jgi:hypothetical protein
MLLMEIWLCRGAEVDTLLAIYTLPCEHALYLPELFYRLLRTFSEITSNSRCRSSPLSGVMLCF